MAKKEYLLEKVGVEIVVQELSTRLVQKGHEVTCYNRTNHKLKKVNNKRYEGVKLVDCLTIEKKGLGAVTSSFIGTIKILFSKNEIVHYHAEGPCIWIWLVKKFSKKKVIATIHGLDWQRAKWGNFATKFIKCGEKAAVKYADEIIVLSKNMQKYFREQYNRETVFIPNGVNKNKKRVAKIIKEKYNLDKDDYILFLARIVPEKGLDYLLSAYKQLNIEKKLVIAGNSSDTDKYYRSILESNKNNKNIIFTGFVEGQELEELYSNAYIYCLPSDIEGMPISLLEAMSYGNCCLTSDIAECKEVIEDCGETFKKGNAKDLEEKMISLIENKETVKQYRNRSEELVLKKYSWTTIVDDLINIYKK